MKYSGMKTSVIELPLRRWPYGLELQSTSNGLVLRPRRTARANWGKSFRRPRPVPDELATTRQLTNNFDAKEWQW